MTEDLAAELAGPDPLEVFAPLVGLLTLHHAQSKDQTRGEQQN
jgi:hypothetical protein